MTIRDVLLSIFRTNMNFEKQMNVIILKRDAEGAVKSRLIVPIVRLHSGDIAIEQSDLDNAKEEGL